MDQLGWEVTDECNVMLKCKVRGKENTRYRIPRNTDQHLFRWLRGLNRWPLVLDCQLHIAYGQSH